MFSARSSFNNVLDQILDSPSSDGIDYSNRPLHLIKVKTGLKASYPNRTERIFFPSSILGQFHFLPRKDESSESIVGEMIEMLRLVTFLVSAGLSFCSLEDQEPIMPIASVNTNLTLKATHE